MFKIGKRIYPNQNDHMFYKPGDYGFDDGEWFARPPDRVSLGSLKNHEVIEHEDGTISVSPSILVEQGNVKWHGYLKKGTWEET